jgi:Gas vesicle synthesis protein GvpL/GvpF
MPILLYCVSTRAAPRSDHLTGVAGLAVSRTEEAELVAFTSTAMDTSVWLQQPLRTAAVEFHRVCGEIFKSTAIIPFRFPTTFGTELELSNHVHERLDRYNSLLARFRDVVQMELRITRQDSESHAGSGAAYLKRQRTLLCSVEHFTDELQPKLSQIVRGWRQRSAAGGSRVFALVDRTAIEKFEDVMRTSSLPSGITVRVSGPWPVSEFIESA